MKNIVRTIALTIALTITLLTCTAAMAESCPTQPHMITWNETENVDTNGGKTWVSIFWLTAELKKLGLENFEITIENASVLVEPEQEHNHQLELVVSISDIGHTCKVFTKIMEDELIVVEGTLMFPKELAEQVFGAIK